MPTSHWWSTWGEVVAVLPSESPRLANELLRVVVAEKLPGFEVVELRAKGSEVRVRVDVRVDRPQDLAADIRAVEPVAFVFTKSNAPPHILSLRDDFPNTPHQSAMADNEPATLCTDDRPPAEAMLQMSGYQLLTRVRTWLERAAMGELNDADQPPEPLFMVPPMTMFLPLPVLSAADRIEHLQGVLLSDNPQALRVFPSEQGSGIGKLRILVLKAAVSTVGRLTDAPRTLDALGRALGGVDVKAAIAAVVKETVGLSDAAIRFGQQVFVVGLWTLTSDVGNTAVQALAFTPGISLGVLGKRLKLLHEASLGQYVYNLAPGQPEAVQLTSVVVHAEATRELVAAASGISPDRRAVTLVGVGALGSQIALNCTRAGRFQFTLIDNDILLPHNVARHALTNDALGAPKALAMTELLSAINGERAVGLRVDVLNPPEEHGASVNAALRDASLVVDASASVAVSRHLSSMTTSARCCATFVSPSGDALVFLAESSDRTLRLTDVEAQYYRLVLDEPALERHLQARGTMRYTDSCRAVSLQVPTSQLTGWAAKASQFIGVLPDDLNAQMGVWIEAADGTVQRFSRRVEPVRRFDHAGWQLSVDEGLLENLHSARDASLPNETGGVLYGVVDMEHRTIHIASFGLAPPGSQSSPSMFERGTRGLQDELARVSEITRGQVRYIGEWHSHPLGHDSSPSNVDIAQVQWLRSQLAVEGLPGLTLIVGEASSVSVLWSHPVERSDAA